MAQHDFIIDDNIPKAVREDINAALVALATNNSGPIAPLITYPYMFWADTSASQTLKIRNAANTDWIVVGTLNQTRLGNARVNLGMNGIGPVFYSNPGQTYRQIEGGEWQRSPIVVNSTPQIFLGYPLFSNLTTAAIAPTQGAQLLTNSITPSFTISTIRIDVQVVLTNPFETNFRGVLALFASTSANPVGAVHQILDRTQTIRATFWHDNHNTTSQITYSLRFGATTDHTSDEDFFMNRGDFTPTLGNTTESWISVAELYYG